jgi:alpha-tubulin suppressor-like RCC1 family protein
MLRNLPLLVLALPACDPTLDPEPPRAQPYDTRAFSLAYTRTALAIRPQGEGQRPVVFDGGRVPAPTDESGNPVLDIPPAEGVALGRRHACVLSPTGSVHCWGSHLGRALGEHRVCTPPPAEGGAPDCTLGVDIMPTLPPVRDLVAGDDVTCAITLDDRVVCWGASDRLGGSRLPALDPPIPVTLPDGERLAAARVILDHGTVCAIARDGVLWCWGDGFGARPVRQPQLGVVDVAFGARHHCIIDADGLRCSGDNRNGQLGDVDHARRCEDKPSCLLDDQRIELDAVRVVVGELHTCALLRDGRVACFGSNEVGQLGRRDAFLVGDIGIALDGAIALDSGYAHVCAQRTDDSVWCWGSTSVTDPRENLP